VAETRHKWSEGDDLVALALSRGCLSLSVGEIAKRRGIPEGSLRMRIGNYNYLQRGEGLSHVAGQSRRIYEDHRPSSNDELRRLALELLGA
jgi:hypothetical protein